MNSAQTEEQDVAVLLRSSPVHDLIPVFPDPIHVPIKHIEIDPTNPGSMTESMRYKRRNPSIRDSWDILGGIIYPVVVCQKPGELDRYIHVDGFGRIDQARQRGESTIRAIIYPPLTLEQRICLRQTLNAAQEPFDVASIIRDLQELATERGLDVRNREHISTLVRDLPEKVRRHEKNLLILARWDADAAARIGEAYGSPSGAMGMDKFKELSGIMDTLSTTHPETFKDLGGDQGVSRKLTDMYLAGRFSEGSRSQEAIRTVKRALKALPANDARVRDYVDGEMDYRVLEQFGQRVPTQPDVIKLCEQLTGLLLTLDATTLSDSQRLTLERTNLVLSKVLG